MNMNLCLKSKSKAQLCTWIFQSLLANTHKKEPSVKSKGLGLSKLLLNRYLSEVKRVMTIKSASEQRFVLN